MTATARQKRRDKLIQLIQLTASDDIAAEQYERLAPASAADARRPAVRRHPGNVTARRPDTERKQSETRSVFLSSTGAKRGTLTPVKHRWLLTSIPGP